MAITTGGVVVVKRPYTKPTRTNVTLTTSAGFDGTGLFTRSSPNIDFFLPGAAVAMKFDGVDNKFSGLQLTTGITLAAEGVKASTKVDDVTVTLTLSGGTKAVQPPAQHKMTSVELLLDISEPRTSAGADPPVLTTPAAAPAAGAASTDKFFGGRPVPLQLPTNYDERAILTVRKVKPATFAGKLILKPENNSVALFAANEFPVKNEPASQPSFEIDAATIPATGKKFFVEGVKASVLARDTGVTLGVKNVTDVGDHVKMTVCHTEIVSNKELKDLNIVVQVPEKPARTTKSPKFLVAPLLVGLEFDIELRHFIEIAVPSAFSWTTPSAKITLSSVATEVVKLKPKTLSGKQDDVDIDLLFTTNIGKLRKRHRLTCVKVEINPVISGDKLVHTNDINFIKNPAGCVILSGGDAGDVTKVPKFEITKIQPNLTFTADDDRIAWWIVGGQAAGAGKYDGKANFHNDEKSKRGTRIQVFGTQAGDVLIQPYSGGFGYGMVRTNVVALRQLKYRIDRIFTTAQKAIPLQPVVNVLPAQAAQPAFPGGGGVAAQPAVPNLTAVPARPSIPVIPARAKHGPTASHVEAQLHIKLVNIYLRPAGIEMIPDTSAEVARPALTARAALPAQDAQPAVLAQVATPAIAAAGGKPAVLAQLAVSARPAVPKLPAMPEIKASVVNPKVGLPTLDANIIAVTQVFPGHFDVEVNNVALTFNANLLNSNAAIQINARNEVMTFGYIESQPGKGVLAAAHLVPANQAPLARAVPARAYTTASYTLPDQGIPSSSLIPKTGIPPDVPVGTVNMIVIPQIQITFQGASPATRDVNLLWGIIVPSANIDVSSSVVAGKVDTLRLAYGNTLAHEVLHVLGLGHRGVAGDLFFDGLTIPAATNIMHPSNPPPQAESIDIIQVKAIRFSEVLFRTP